MVHGVGVFKTTFRRPTGSRVQGADPADLLRNAFDADAPTGVHVLPAPMVPTPADQVYAEVYTNTDAAVADSVQRYNAMKHQSAVVHRLNMYRQADHRKLVLQGAAGLFDTTRGAGSFRALSSQLRSGQQPGSSRSVRAASVSTGSPKRRTPAPRSPMRVPSGFAYTQSSPVRGTSTASPPQPPKPPQEPQASLHVDVAVSPRRSSLSPRWRSLSLAVPTSPTAAGSSIDDVQQTELQVQYGHSVDADQFARAQQAVEATISAIQRTHRAHSRVWTLTTIG